MQLANLSRRKFLLSLTAVSAMLSGLVLFAKKSRSANPNEVGNGAKSVGGDPARIILLKVILQRQLPYVVIDQQTLETFYQDLSQSKDRFESLLIVEERLREYPRLLHDNMPDPIIRFYGTNLAREFLLSTSYFYDKKMRYLGLYSPYTRPCQNPFAKLG